jgi:hypothetical protein
VLLKPSQGTHGREMNRNRRIASALALAGFLCMPVSSTAVAAGPQLSGYGGPGAGEQTILGSTLLGGAGGGSGGGSASGGSGGASSSGGSGGSGSSRGAAQAGSGGSAAGGAGSSTTRRSGGGISGGSSGAPGGSTGGTSASSGGGAPTNTHSAQPVGGKIHSSARAAVTGVYVYPSSLRLASSDSSAFAISGGDVLVLIVVVLAIALVGVLTMRLGRLQR